jgi:hypothetical protein
MSKDEDDLFYKRLSSKFRNKADDYMEYMGKIKKIDILIELYRELQDEHPDFWIRYQQYIEHYTELKQGIVWIRSFDNEDEAVESKDRIEKYLELEVNFDPDNKTILHIYPPEL